MWVRLKIKGHGRQIPASVNIKVGSSLYECPIWAERRPWVDWFSTSKPSPDGRRPPELRKAAARDSTFTSRLGLASGIQKGRNVKSQVAQETLIKGDRRKGRKVQWIKVGDKNISNTKGHNMKSHILNSDDQPTPTKDLTSFNRFDILNPLNGANDVVRKTWKEKWLMTWPHSMITVHKEPKAEDMTSDKSSHLIVDGSVCGSMLSPENVTDYNSDSHLDGSFGESTVLPHKIFPNATVSQANDNIEMLDCQPLAISRPEEWPLTVYRPEEWSMPDEALLLGDCGQDQKIISRWVINRMKSFKKILGISCEGFEDKIMDLLQSIEMRRSLKSKGEGKKAPGSSRRSGRELKNLQCTITYDRGRKT